MNGVTEIPRTAGGRKTDCEAGVWWQGGACLTQLWAITRASTTEPQNEKSSWAESTKRRERMSHYRWVSTNFGRGARQRAPPKQYSRHSILEMHDSIATLPEYCDQCVCLCLCVRLSLREHISGTRPTSPTFTKFFVHVICNNLRPWLGPQSSGGFAIRYVLPVLWITWCLHIMGQIYRCCESLYRRAQQANAPTASQWLRRVLDDSGRRE